MGTVLDVSRKAGECERMVLVLHEAHELNRACLCYHGVPFATSTGAA
jgi:hypothetical protein